MSRNLIRTTLILGTLATAAAGIASMLSSEENRKKVKTTANDLSRKATEIIHELEDDYQELDKNLNKYSKTREYKQKVEEVTNASKEILKQMEILRSTSTQLLKAFKREAGKALD